jgi:hypothetical protein
VTSSSERNVGVVRRITAANRSGPQEETVEVAVALTDPASESVSRVTSIEGSTYKGHAGVRGYFADMADAFKEWRNDLGAVEEVEPGVVLADLTFRGTGNSGVEVELESSVIFVISSGRVRRIHAAPSRAEALAAAGLSEQRGLSG